MVSAKNSCDLTRLTVSKLISSRNTPEVYNVDKGASVAQLEVNVPPSTLRDGVKTLFSPHFFKLSPIHASYLLRSLHSVFAPSRREEKKEATIRAASFESLLRIF